jgi:nicotinamide mononucleotide transporter
VWLDVIEVLIFLLNVLYVLLASVRSVWCWLPGILASVIQGVLMFYHKLYAETGLMGFYVVMGGYGWISWRNQMKMKLKIYEISLYKHLLFNIIVAVLAWGLFYILKKYTDANSPLIDSFTTVYGIAITWMVAKSIHSNWIYWVFINLVTAWLYLSRGLEILSLQMIIMSGMAAWGYYRWNKLQLQNKEIDG